MSASHDYAERIRARLPRILQEVREAAGLSRYALEKKCGVSREMIGCIEGGDSIPTLEILVGNLSLRGSDPSTQAEVHVVADKVDVVSAPAVEWLRL